ncbi:MAG: AAA family ATPase [bacterium]
MTLESTKRHSKKSTGKIFRFSFVHIENWRNFLRAEVQLQKRVFLIGPNASGKSNFLDIFRFLHDIVSVGGGFQEATRRRGGVSSLRSLAARRYPNIVIKVKIGDLEEKELWEYEIHFSQDNLSRPIIKKEIVKHRGRLILSRPDKKDNKDSERLTQTYLEQVNANGNFREIADFFHTQKYLHIVPQLIREPDRSVGRKNDPFGGDFLEQIALTSERSRNAKLKKIKDALRVAVPQLEEIELSRDNKGAPHLRGKYSHWRARGAWQTEDHFSDGTLRLLGLLWATLDGTGPLLLEEPELSLHPEVVKLLPQMLARVQRKSGRQIFISTHSSDLLNDEGIGKDEVLLLLPSIEGTEIRTANSITEIDKLLQEGINLSEIVIPNTKPKSLNQLLLFGD